MSLLESLKSIGGEQWDTPNHIRFMADCVDPVMTKPDRKIAFFLPPRHGGTEFLARFAATYLCRHPDRNILWVGCNAEIADHCGSKVRGMIRNRSEKVFGVNARKEASATADFRMEAGGLLKTCGLGSDLTGHGFHLIVMDSPVQDADKGRSAKDRDKALDWCHTSLATRLLPGGSEVARLIQWAPDDFADWFAAELVERARPTLKAIADDDDPAGRRPGEALWPEMWPLAELQKRAARDPYWFRALYQHEFDSPSLGL